MRVRIPMGRGGGMWAGGVAKSTRLKARLRLPGVQ